MEDQDLFQKLSKRDTLMRILTTKLVESMGDVAKWDASEIRKAKNFLGEMDLESLRSLDNKAVKTALPDLKEVIFRRRDLKAALAEKVVEALGGVENASHWTAEDIVK